MKRNLKLYAKISKVDEEQRMVWGYASTEALDSQGEVIERAAIEKALDGYMEFANIREMHRDSAVGVTKEAAMDEKGLFIGAHVVDDVAWKKVTTGVYKGFSIGGVAGERKGNRIKSIDLYEISLVDRPANPEARFECFKLNNGSQGMKKLSAAKLAKSERAMEAVAALARLLGLSEDELKDLEGEDLAAAVLAAYEEHEKPAEEDAVGQAMEAAVESLVESVDEMVSEGELEEETAAAEEAASDEEKADGEEEQELTDEEKAAKAEEEEAAAAAAAEEEAKRKAEGAEDEEDKEKVAKSAYNVSEAACLAERVMEFSNQLEFVSDWGEAPVSLAVEVRDLAVQLYTKMSELAVFEAERMASVAAEENAGLAAAPAAEGEASETSTEAELIEAVAQKAAEAALAKAAKTIEALTARLETLEKGGVVNKGRFAPRQFGEEAKAGLTLVTKGGAEVTVKTVAEAKGAGASMKDVLKGVFAGRIQG